jgi:hypothetical protein
LLLLVAVVVVRLGEAAVAVELFIIPLLPLQQNNLSLCL